MDVVLLPSEDGGYFHRSVLTSILCGCHMGRALFEAEVPSGREAVGKVEEYPMAEDCMELI